MHRPLDGLKLYHLSNLKLEYTKNTNYINCIEWHTKECINSQWQTHYTHWYGLISVSSYILGDARTKFLHLIITTVVCYNNMSHPRPITRCFPICKYPQKCYFVSLKTCISQHITFHRKWSFILEKIPEHKKLYQFWEIAIKNYPFSTGYSPGICTCTIVLFYIEYPSEIWNWKTNILYWVRPCSLSQT